MVKSKQKKNNDVLYKKVESEADDGTRVVDYKEVDPESLKSNTSTCWRVCKKALIVSGVVLTVASLVSTTYFTFASNEKNAQDLNKLHEHLHPSQSDNLTFSGYSPFDFVKQVVGLK